MRSRLSLALAVAGASVLAGGADAASTIFGGSATLRAGYGKNPNFDSSRDGSSGVVGGNLTATLSRITGKGQTSLTGAADVTQSGGGLGRAENYSVRLGQTEQVNPKLSLSGGVGYQDTTNPSANYSTSSRDLVPIGDVLTIGTHTRQVNGDINAGYQLDSKDLIQIGATAVRTTYSSANASAYTQFGGTIGYLRNVSATTRIGVQGSALRVHSGQFDSSSSYSAGLVLTQQFGPRWTFQGGLSGLVQSAFGGTFKTIGFNASMCGDYTRITVCALASRSSAASGIGGLRIDTQGGVRVNYKLGPRSSLDLSGTYDVSAAKDVALPTQRYIDAAMTYGRTITPRLSAGLSARYQRRTFSAVGLLPRNDSRTTSYVATGNITYFFGRRS